jgi:hypothetical protein
VASLPESLVTKQCQRSLEAYQYRPDQYRPDQARPIPWAWVVRPVETIDYGSLDAAEIGYWVCLLTALMHGVKKWARVVAPPPSSTKADQLWTVR